MFMRDILCHGRKANADNRDVSSFMRGSDFCFISIVLSWTDYRGECILKNTLWSSDISAMVASVVIPKLFLRVTLHHGQDALQKNHKKNHGESSTSERAALKRAATSQPRTSA